MQIQKHLKHRRIKRNQLTFLNLSFPTQKAPTVFVPLPPLSQRHLSSPNRRRWLQCAALAGAAPAAWAAPAATTAGRAITVAQIADLSAAQQDVSRDFVTGARAAWQAFNAQGGLAGRPVQHRVLETNGSAASLQAAWQQAQTMADCVALSGCVGHTAASLSALHARSGSAAPLAQVAPWLQGGRAGAGDAVFDIFPGYQAQIAHALKTLASMGVQDIGVAYGTAQLQQQSQAEIAEVTQTLQLRTQTLPLASGAAAQAAQRHVLLLFVGGTPELHDLLRQIQLPPGRQCYVVALADVNLQVLAQMGSLPRNTSVIATQTVPLLTSPLPVVRAYRSALARLYDEPPSPQGLAGFIAARYTVQALERVDGPVSRASVLAALRRNSHSDIGGFTVAFQGSRRTSTYVTQTMLTADGRIVG